MKYFYYVERICMNIIQIGGKTIYLFCTVLSTYLPLFIIQVKIGMENDL